jgi:hypothetical protein
MDSTGSEEYLVVGAYDHDSEPFGLLKPRKRIFCAPEQVSGVLELPCKSVTE